MSFNDLSPPKMAVGPSGKGVVKASSGIAAATGTGELVGRRPSSSANSFGFENIASSLQQFQKQCTITKDKITDLRRKKNVGSLDKEDLDNLLKELRDIESRLKNILESELKLLENLPRTAENAQKRIALGKLQKDFERVKVGMQAIVNESSLIKVTQNSGNSTSGDDGSVFSRIEETAYTNELTNATKQPRLLQSIKGNEVDQLIMEERERDIRKLNSDLQMVHEMFKDMASIVEKQGEIVEEIAITTETSHERAKAGLVQVQQAAAHQSTCIVS